MDTLNIAPEHASTPTVSRLFWGFFAIGLSGFGGVLPFARRMLVEQRGWLSAEEFNTKLGLCQFIPGPNTINLAIVVGRRYQRLLGAIAAPLGLLIGPLILTLILAMLYDCYGALPQAQGALRGIAVVGCGLLFAMAWRMGLALRNKCWFLPLTAFIVAAIALLHWSTPLVMAVGLVISSIVGYWVLGRL